MSASGSEVWLEGNWWEALPFHPLFQVLKEKHEGDEGRNSVLLCESRGDLFVWSSVLYCLLTTNLKRLQARREEGSLFQYLHPTTLPLGGQEVVSLSASPSGQYIALCCRESVIVVVLRRQRGPSGEFAGGMPDVDCRSAVVAGDLLQAHCLQLVQVSWTGGSDGLGTAEEVMVLLTSDGVLRLCSVSCPTVPIASIGVSTSLGHAPNMLYLEEEESIVGFAVWRGKRALLLHERMDVQALDLKPGAIVGPTLPIYPLSQDNYNGGGCAMLLLETTPPILVLATDSGQLHHCIYLCQSTVEEREEQEGEELLSVVESVALPVQEEEGHATMDNDRLRLLPDPSRRDSYVVLSSSGLFQVEIPWVGRMDRVPEVGFAAEPGCTVHQLLWPADSVLDVAVVSDQLLGSVAIVLLDGYECMGFPLTKSTRGSALVGLALRLPGLEMDSLTTAGTFAQHIHSLLQVSNELVLPLHRRESGKVGSDLSQQECLEYLQLSIQQLRHKYLVPQTRAKAELCARIDLLSQRKKRQFHDLSLLMNKCQDLTAHGDELGEKMDTARRRGNVLLGQMECVLGSVATCSPVLSNAEQSMAQELRSIQEKLSLTKLLLEKAQAKLQLGLGRVTVAGQSGTSSLGSAHMDTLLSSLSADGRHIKAAVQQLKDLMAFANSN